MKKLRKQLIIWLFEKSQRIYTAMFKNHQSWTIAKTDLLIFPKPTYGRHLGEFLNNNNFELIPKVERHDCYHLLCGYSTEVANEIALQCLCFGNGKRSLYLYGAIILGTVILPDYWRYYYKPYKVGKNANALHPYDYKTPVKLSIEDFRFSIFSKSFLIQNQ